MPRAPVAGPHGRNSAGVQEIEHFGAKLRVAIEDEILVLRTFGERLAELLYDPFTGGMLCAIEMDDLPVIICGFKNKQYRMRKFAVMTVKKSIPAMLSG